MAPFRDLCSVEEIPDGQARMFIVEQTTICVVRLGEEYFALRDACPHAGASLAQGYVHEGAICCRVHHWQFSVRHGTYLDEDKPAMNVEVYPIRIVENRVQVRIG